MDVFISWSGPQSKIIAEALGPWLQSVLQFVKPFISVDIEKDIRYEAQISQKLQDCNFGVICVTPESVKSSWVLFEAGALSKLQADARVYTYVLGMKKGEVPQPLGQFQGTETTREDTKKLVDAINRRAETQVSEQVLSRAFEKFWPDLEEAIGQAAQVGEASANAPTAVNGKVLSVEEMTAEILDHVRGIRTSLRNSSLDLNSWRRRGEGMTANDWNAFIADDMAQRALINKLIHGLGPTPPPTDPETLK